MNRFGVPTLYLLIVFACGLALGGFGVRYYDRSLAVEAGHPPRPEVWKERHLKEMQSRLKLTSDQTSHLSSILDDTRGEIRKIMDKQRPDMERIQAEQYARVKAILTPEQIPEYEKYHAEREQQRRAMGRP